MCYVHGVTKSWTRLSNRTELKQTPKDYFENKYRLLRIFENEKIHYIVFLIEV